MDCLSLAYMIRVLENENLHRRNSFGIQARSRYWISFDDQQQLVELINKPPYNLLPRFFIGSGTNLLFIKNYPGCLIHAENREINILKESEEQIQIEVGAGMEWDELVQWTVDLGYYGLENLSLIPGSVGAAAVQNIGAYGVEVGNIVSEVQIVDIKKGDSFFLSQGDCHFTYRQSILKNQGNKTWLVWRVRFILSKTPKYDLSYGSLSEMVNASGDLTQALVREVIIATRRSRLPDPARLGNAGSFFKNPLISVEQFNHIKQINPLIPYYTTTIPGIVKIPAAWMIEKAGWKGYRNLSAGVYEKQALVLVNFGEAKGSEIMKLAKDIQESVQQLFGIKLEPEVTIIGE